MDLSGAGGFLGGIAGGASNYWSTRETNKQNLKIAREQMRFQERMAKTAHQREVDDLIKAGLNPNLSAGGNGAAVPSGASATMVAPQIDLPGIISAISATQTQQKIDLDKDRVGIEKAKAAADIAKKADEQDLIKMKKILSQKGLIRAEAEGEASRALKSLIEKMKKWSPKETGKRMGTELYEMMNTP